MKAAYGCVVGLAAFLSPAAAAALAARRAQAAEPSWTASWDNQIASCLDAVTAYPQAASATLTQTSFNQVRVTFTGLGGSVNGQNPRVWITNEEGTVIDSETLNLGTNSRTYTWDLTQARQKQPTAVSVHTCPPLSTLSTPVRTWAGLYDDVAAYCCAEIEPTAAEVSAYSMTLNLNWQQQTFTVSAPSAAKVLNYVRDASGTVIGAAGPGWDNPSTTTSALTTNDFGPTGNNAALSVTPLASSLIACAINGELKKEICTTVDLLSPAGYILDNLQTNNNNPGTFPSALTVTYASSDNGATAKFTYADSGRSGYCVMYARTARNSGDVLGFVASEYQSNNAPSNIELALDVGDSATYTNAVIHACCGVTHSPGSNPPVRCPGGQLKAQSFVLADLRSAANTQALTAFTTAGFGTFSTDLVRTENSVCYDVFQVRWNAGSNFTNTSHYCECEDAVYQGDVLISKAYFSCSKLSAFDRFLTTQQKVLFVFTGLIGVALIVGFLVCYLKKSSTPKTTYQNTMVQIPSVGNPSATERA